jgi:hypothetical protein
MDKELAQYLSDIFKSNGLFEAHEILENFINDDCDVDELKNNIADLSERTLLGEVDEDEQEQKVYSKTMVSCGSYLCELRNLNSISNVDEWNKNNFRFGLKFNGLGIDHTEWFNHGALRNRERSKLIRSLAKKQVNFI